MLCVDPRGFASYRVVTATTASTLAPTLRESPARSATGMATGGGWAALDSYDAPVDASTSSVIRWSSGREVGMRIDPGWTDPWMLQVTSIFVE